MNFSRKRAREAPGRLTPIVKPGLTNLTGCIYSECGGFAKGSTMKVFLPMLAVGLAVGGAASAATVSFTHTIAATPVPFTSNFTLSSFNTALGTLTGVEIVVDDTSVATVDIFNLNSTTESFTDASATVPLTVTGPDGSMITNSVTAGPISGVAGVGLSTFTGLSASNVVSLSIAPAAFSSYESATPQNLSFTASAGDGTYTGTGGFGVLFGGSAVAGGTVEVNYTYSTAVPEPASWALMIVGFGMMGGVLRRRVGASTQV